MRPQKWKNMKIRKKVFARIGPNVDSNFHGNERVMHYANSDFSKSSMTNISYKPWLSNSEWNIYVNNALKIFFT